VSEPFVGQISSFAFSFAPKGWASANGQILPINQNQALFALLGTQYGGDGIRTFALPNLQGRVAVHNGGAFVIGETGGAEFVTLTTSQLPAHSHTVNCNKNAGTQASPGGNLWAADGAGNAPYSNGGGTALAGGAIAPVGGSQAHNNVAPLLVVNFCIALVGIFPSRN
jgi:microcystin-dependent protein